MENFMVSWISWSQMDLVFFLLLHGCCEQQKNYRTLLYAPLPNNWFLGQFIDYQNELLKVSAALQSFLLSFCRKQNNFQLQLILWQLMFDFSFS